MSRDYRAEARRAAKKHGINPDLFERQIGQESGFNPRARSPAGARGIAQIMPATAKGWGVDPSDPVASLDAAAKNMSRYLRSYSGSWAKALTAYNAGPGRVGKPLYAETANYIKTILDGKSDVRDGAKRATATTERPVKARTEFDSKGYDLARRRSALAGYLSKKNPDSLLLKTGAISTREPQVDDFVKTIAARRATTSKPAKATGGSLSSDLVRSVQTFDRLAARIGVPITARQEPGHASGGDHDPAVKGATARDFGGGEAERKRLFQQVVRKLGVKGATYKGADIDVVKDGIRYQVISRDHGTGPHLHVGMRRA